MVDPPKSSSSDSEGSTDVEDLLAEARRVRMEGTGPVEGENESQNSTVEISGLDASNGDGHGTNHGEPPQPSATAAAKQPPTASRRARIAGIRKKQPTTNKRGGSRNSTAKNSTVTVVAAADTTTPSKRKAPPESITTARAGGSGQKRKKQTKRVGARVKISKSNLYHLLDHDEQRYFLSGLANARLFYGTIISGQAKGGYKVKFDQLPVGFQEVEHIQTQRLHTVPEGSEEPDFDREIQDASAAPDPALEEDATSSPVDGSLSKRQKQSAADFLKQSKDDIKVANSFSMEYGSDPKDVIEWEIWPDGQHITDERSQALLNQVHCPFKKDLGYTIEKDLSGEWDYNAIFFEHFFPSFRGHAKLMDEYLSSPQAKYHSTVEQDGIQFYQPDAPWFEHDPDQLIRVCYTLMLCAANEVHQGIDNLWLHGPSPGRHPFPDYGRYIPKNYMKAFLSAAPYMWADKKHWYQQYSEEQWEVFIPMLQDFNDKRSNLMSCIFLMLDESMSGWRPKTSKTGGFPNCKFPTMAV